MTWRDKIRPMVAAVISAHRESDLRTIRRALVQARPGWVKHCSWQLRIWRDETNRQLLLKDDRSHQIAKSRAAFERDQERGQLMMFSPDEF